MPRPTPLRLATLGFIHATASSSTSVPSVAALARPTLTAAAQQTAHLLRSQRSDTDSDASATITSQTPSIKTQGEAEQATDLTNARNLQEYRRRKVAPTLSIPTALKDNLPSFRRPTNKRKVTATAPSTGHISARNVTLQAPAYTPCATPALAYGTLTNLSRPFLNRKTLRSSGVPRTSPLHKTSQIYFAISGGKGVDLATLSQDFATEANFPTTDTPSTATNATTLKTSSAISSTATTLVFPAPASLTSRPAPAYRSVTIAQTTRTEATPSRTKETSKYASAGWTASSSPTITRPASSASNMSPCKFQPPSPPAHPPSTEIDQRVFGSTALADQAFKLSVSLLEILFHRCIAAFPDQPLDVIIKHTPKTHDVTAYIEPRDSTESPKPCQAITLTMENLLDDQPVVGPVIFSADKTKTPNSIARKGMQQQQQDLLAMTSLWAPEGQTAKSMSRDTPSATPKIKWRDPGPRQLQLRKEAKDSGKEYEQRKRSWKKGRVAWKI
ncbi:hypothetical protein IAR55_001188 [Kwoniella newhampshirensis]|uniref:Uncharacterized protein n=1 Tax=Kwoniella newhampshirensis TaxID=1651941 RepID=A0AAW0Z504_9TREE